MSGNEIVHHEPGDAVRIEQLVKVGATVTVHTRILREHGATELALEQLRDQLQRCVTRLGRLPVGETTVTVAGDAEHDLLVYRAQVLTRESDEGEWPSVWRAIHEDENPQWETEA